ncbi:MAG: flagellar motor switch protein FliM [Ruminococcus sp.]|nr:flagellar motor switch protein FliM [Ruminococcus sp.]
MADALSQSQIDELLKNISSGEEKIDEIEAEASMKKVKAYDFRMPKKFTKEQLNVIENIFESYGRVLSSYFTSLLRLYCKTEIVQIEEQRYFEFNNALPDYTMISVVNLGTRDDDIQDAFALIQINNAVTTAMIDRMEGGEGHATDLSRDFSEIEVGLMNHVFDRMAVLMKEPWSTYIDLNPGVTNLETNARAMQVLGPDEIVILATLEVELNDVKNNICFIIPALTLEAMMAKFGDKYAKSAKKLDPKKEVERRDSLLQNIKDSELGIKAVFCETKMQFWDVLTLRPGDIMPLPMPIDGNVDIKIGGNIWYDGKLGIMNSNKAIKIDNVYNERFLKRLFGIIEKTGTDE